MTLLPLYPAGNWTLPHFSILCIDLFASWIFPDRFALIIGSCSCDLQPAALEFMNFDT